MSSMNDYLSGWMGHRKALLELIDVFEDEQLTFKPWDGAMSVAELSLHTSSAMVMFAQTVKNGVFTPPPATQTVETVKELKALVEKETEQAKTELEALTDEQLNKLIEFAGMEMPGAALLQLAKDHEIHHKGQLFTYARIVGATELPNIVSR